MPDDIRTHALSLYQQARAIYLPTESIPANTPPSLAVAIALTELIAAQISVDIARNP